MFTTTSQPRFPSHCQVLNSLQYAETGGLFYHMNDYLGRQGGRDSRSKEQVLLVSIQALEF